MKPGCGIPSPTAVALAGTALLAAAMGIGRFAYTPLLPPLVDARGWSMTQAGDVASANFLGYVLGAMAAGWLAQRPSARTWLWLGMAGSVATTAAGALAASLSAWLAIRFLSGLASALCLVIGTALIVDHLARHGRAGLSALHFAGVGAGIIVSVAVIETIGRKGDVTHLWAATGAAAALLAVACALVLRRIPAPPPRGHAARTGGLRPDRRLWRLILAYGAHGFGYVVTATFIVAIARSLPDAGLIEPLTWLVVGVAAAPSILVWQRVARRTGMGRALVLAHAIEAAGVMLVGLARDPASLLVGALLLGATFMGITALGLAAAREVAPARGEATIGWMTAAFGVGQWIGPAVAGRLAQWSGGFGLPSAVAAALLAAGMVLMWEPRRMAP